MTRDDVKQAIIKALIEIQSYSGRAVEEINEATRPIGDLQDFDSLNIVEAVVRLSDLLDQNIEPSLLLDWSGGRPPRLGEIINRICRRIGTQLGGN